VPGSYPYTAGVFAFKREGEDPTRMFAGEGDAFRTNQRFRRVSEGMPAHRLSTAFDSVTLYGWNPDPRPDIYGKVGNAGVLHRDAGRHEGAVLGLRSERTDDFRFDDHQWAGADDSRDVHEHRDRPASGEVFSAKNAREPTADEAQKIKAWTLATVRRYGAGRHTERGPGPEHLYLLHRVRAQDDGATCRNISCTIKCGISTRSRSPDTTSPKPARNPISQLAFTLANGFTYVESYLARGMHVDDFAPNLSFFFSNGMDPEYSVIGRVGAPYLGGGDEEPLRRETSAVRSSSITCRLPAVHCTHRRWRSTTSAPRCRRCARSTTIATACTPTPMTRP